jgi:hypothetical protein
LVVLIPYLILLVPYLIIEMARTTPRGAQAVSGPMGLMMGMEQRMLMARK